MERVLARPATRIEYRSVETVGGCQTNYGRLRPANIPRRRFVLVGRVPVLSRQPFVTGWN